MPQNMNGRPPAYLWKRQRGRQGKVPQIMSGRPPGFLQGRQTERQGRTPQERKTREVRRAYDGWIGRRRLSRRGALWRTTVGSVGIPRPDARNSSVPRPRLNGQE